MLGDPEGGPPVAHGAHLMGYAEGFLAGTIALLTPWRKEKDRHLYLILLRVWRRLKWREEYTGSLEKYREENIREQEALDQLRIEEEKPLEIEPPKPVVVQPVETPETLEKRRLIETLIREGKTDKAVEEFLPLFRKTPDFALEPLYQMQAANFVYEKGDLETCLAILRRFITLYASDRRVCNVYYNLANLLAQMSRFGEALEAIETCLKLPLNAILSRRAKQLQLRIQECL
jgi:tetratricopeptide (TPR) repeat protein